MRFLGLTGICVCMCACMFEAWVFLICAKFHMNFLIGTNSFRQQDAGCGEKDTKQISEAQGFPETSCMV